MTRSPNPPRPRAPLTTLTMPETAGCGSCGWFSPEVAPDGQTVPRGAAWCLNPRSEKYSTIVRPTSVCEFHSWARARRRQLNWMGIAALLAPWLIIAAVVVLVSCTPLAVPRG